VNTAAVRDKLRHYWRKEIRPLLWLALVVFSIRSSLADWNDVPTGSMKPTILEGDRVYVNKVAYDLKVPFTTWHIAQWGDPARGDIVVFYSPHDGQRLVKRVIGLPGDRLKVEDQRVYVNGKPLTEPYVVHDPGAGYDPLNYAFPPMGNQLYASPVVMEWAHEIKKYVRGEEIVVPPGKYFAMGDNRDHSLDSRYWGFVDRDAIMGRPFLIYWSVEANSGDYAQSSFLQRLKSVVDTLLHLPQRTRWSRMLRTVH